jgi:hypothetical protein
MSTFLKRHARIPKSATPSQFRSGVASESWFRGLTVVVALLVAATACGETTSSDPAEEVSAVVEVPDQCPDGLRVIEDPEATKDLRCADLTDARLTGATLTDADLTGADLTDANLTGAFLDGANLTGATLTDANLTGTNWADTTCPDGSDNETNGRNSCP